MKKSILFALIAFFLVGVATDADAQRRKRKRPTERTSERDRDREAKTTGIMDKLNIEIKPGNLFIGSTTNLSLKSNVGYKFNKTFSAGVGGKYFYYWQSRNPAPALSLHDVGAFVYGRAILSRQFYIAAEYNYISLDAISGPRSGLSFPAAGIGYMTPGLNWSSGVEVLFIFSEQARNRLSLPIDYWINFSYNF